MISLHLNDTIFAAEFTELFGTILRPKAWLSFRFQVEEVVLALANMEIGKSWWIKNVKI